MRTPDNTNNGHFPESRVSQNLIYFQTPLYGNCLSASFSMTEYFTSENLVQTANYL